MKRLPVALSTAALVVAVLGATPLGRAGRIISTIPPFAKSAHHADVAANALRLNGHKASAVGGAGTIPVLDGKGKLPPSIGAVGQQGPAGPAGPRATRAIRARRRRRCGRSSSLTAAWALRRASPRARRTRTTAAT